SGLPARFHQPLPKEYRTVSQGFLRSLTPNLRLFQWPDTSQLPVRSGGHIVGIDFGTSLSSIAVLQNAGQPELIPNDFGEGFTPSAVAIADDGTPIIGQRAADYILRRPERGVLEVKRLFGREIAQDFEGNPVLDVDGVAYTPVHLAAFILERLRRDAEEHLECSVSKAVLTAPAYFGPSQFAALVNAA